MPSTYDAEAKAEAIRLVTEHRDEYPSEWAAITAVAGRLGMTGETLRSWIRQAAVDDGKAEGVSTAAAKEIRELEGKNAELEKTIEILEAATCFFVRESDPKRRCFVRSSPRIALGSGSFRSAVPSPRRAARSLRERSMPG